MKRSRTLASALASLCISASSLSAAELPSTDSVMMSAFTQGVVVDLREPLISDGTLSTHKGGVVTTENIRIQAQSIRYTKKSDGDEEIHRLVAEGDVMVEYAERCFVAERIEYDYITAEGTLWSARTGIKRWYIGGEVLQLHCDGSFTVEDAFLTTCENKDSEWQIRSAWVKVLPSGIFTAHSTQFRFIRIPILWVPSFGTNLDKITSAPLKYDFQWGGHQGPRITVRYQALATETWEAWARLDYRLQRGLAGGIETDYNSPDDCETFYTLNYLAKDSSSVDPTLSTRYLFKGCYQNTLDDGRTQVDLKYEKHSDEDMETDYYDKDFEFHNAGRSDLSVNSQSDWWTVHFLTRPRLNSFMSIKEEIPSIDVSNHPIEIANTGIINDSRLRCGYYQFRYADTIPGADNYQSVRVESRSRLYRTSKLGCLSLTPELEGIVIGYSHSPGENLNEGQVLAIGHASFDASMSAYGIYPCTKHVIQPYVHYDYYSSPGAAVANHYVFDIDDGWEKLNVATIGLRNNWYAKDCCQISKCAELDLYTDVFFERSGVPRTIPRLYANSIWNVSSCLRLRSNIAWDFEREKVTNSNWRLEYTQDEDFALAAELRFRDSRFWRKVDARNLFLEAARSEDELVHSGLSDRRSTILAHAYWRFAPLWTLEGKARYGYCREDEPNYLEYQADLYTTLRCSWRVRVSYQHKEHDDRYTMYVGLAKKPPSHSYYRAPEWGS